MYIIQCYDILNEAVWINAHAPISGFSPVREDRRYNGAIGEGWVACETAFNLLPWTPSGNDPDHWANYSFVQDKFIIVRNRCSWDTKNVLNDDGLTYDYVFYFNFTKRIGTPTTVYSNPDYNIIENNYGEVSSGTGNGIRATGTAGDFGDSTQPDPSTLTPPLREYSWYEGLVDPFAIFKFNVTGGFTYV